MIHLRLSLRQRRLLDARLAPLDEPEDDRLALLDDSARELRESLELELDSRELEELLSEDELEELLERVGVDADEEERVGRSARVEEDESEELLEREAVDEDEGAGRSARAEDERSERVDGSWLEVDAVGRCDERPDDVPPDRS